jgi:Icc-related predicted phosphoesterase
MRVYAFSDQHGHLDFDIPRDATHLICAGDICPNFNPRGMKTEMSKQLIWLTQLWRPSLRGLPTIATFGNHDYLNPHLEGTQGIYADETYTHEDTVTRFWMSPWSNLFGRGWAWMDIPAELKARYAQIPHNTDVIVSHGPPYGYGDTTSPLWWAENGRPDEDPHLGSKELLARIDVVEPRIVICGHIHGGHGTYNHVTPSGKSVVIYNVSLLNDSYQLTHEPTLIQELSS